MKNFGFDMPAVKALDVNNPPKFTAEAYYLFYDKGRTVESVIGRIAPLLELCRTDA